MVGSFTLRLKNVTLLSGLQYSNFCCPACSIVTLLTGLQYSDFAVRLQYSDFAARPDKSYFLNIDKEKN